MQNGKPMKTKPTTLSLISHNYNRNERNETIIHLDNNKDKYIFCIAKCRSKLRGAGHCISAKRFTSILSAEAFPPARQGTIQNSHRVIGIATNTSMVIN